MKKIKCRACNGVGSYKGYGGIIEECDKCGGSGHYEDKIISILDSLTPEERVVIFNEYCVACGDKNPMCQCFSTSKGEMK